MITPFPKKAERVTDGCSSVLVRSRTCWRQLIAGDENVFSRADGWNKKRADPAGQRGPASGCSAREVTDGDSFSCPCNEPGLKGRLTPPPSSPRVMLSIPTGVPGAGDGVTIEGGQRSKPLLFRTTSSAEAALLPQASGEERSLSHAGAPVLIGWLCCSPVKGGRQRAFSARRSHFPPRPPPPSGSLTPLAASLFPFRLRLHSMM